ncbi:hypothetical protein GKC30_08155 [Pseudodesulfovibrio sp. F-1]|uniref:Uncharacterized protein n=1 Tax=Pseudodesulfovibrio alkaliphilus TaxID=2661613 RepID=A0A7K1KNY4_9BACT|nr:hypothetical protein [Pseudodesulfovibrio alkaliphilus]MUM77602.1 hypothetical protein [Pseudodesulfovibrio alkaliphilus]
MRNRQPLTNAQRAVVVVMDILLLVELSLCMYWSSANPETMVTSFMKTFLPIASITLFAAWFTIKRLAPANEEPALQEGA